MEIWLQPIGREGQTQYDWLVKLGIKLIFNVNIKALGSYTKCLAIRLLKEYL